MTKARVSCKGGKALVSYKLRQLGLPPYRLTASARTGTVVVTIHDFQPDPRLADVQAFAATCDFQVEAK